MDVCTFLVSVLFCLILGFLGRVKCLCWGLFDARLPYFLAVDLVLKFNFFRVHESLWIRKYNIKKCELTKFISILFSLTRPILCCPIPNFETLDNSNKKIYTSQNPPTIQKSRRTADSNFAGTSVSVDTRVPCSERDVILFCLTQIKEGDTND